MRVFEAVHKLFKMKSINLNADCVKQNVNLGISPLT